MIDLARVLGMACALAIVPLAATATPMAGGQTKADPANPEIHAVADFAVKKWNQDHPKEAPIKLQKIVQARQQVVAGIRYVLTVTLRSEGATHDFSSSLAVWKKPDGSLELAEPPHVPKH